jgi:hypothetical protein
MKKLKLSAEKIRASFPFEYELKDGIVVVLTYKAPAKKHIDKAIALKEDDFDSLYNLAKEILEDCLEGEKIEEVLKEQFDANILEFKELLDYELGKQKKRG